MVDGSKWDDSFGHRPGMNDSRKLDINSPLYECKFKKKEIRNLSKKINLPTWNKPSIACLASRFPYGKKITKEILQKIDSAENFIRDLGFKQVRVRYYENTVRIEVNKDKFFVILNKKDDIIKN